MKEIYKQRGESHSPRRRARRTQDTNKRRPQSAYARRRRLVGVVFVVACALLAVILAGYLLGGGGSLWGDRASVMNAEPEQEQPASSAGEAEEPAAAEDQAAAGEPAPTVLLGEYFTDYAWDPDAGRQSNLRKASGAINETRLAPGEEFSALEVLSPLEYEPAKVFANGGVDYEVGGGLCQVSSTLYMAANYAGLEIMDRNPHYAELPYIRPGFDATVWFGDEGKSGALDMKFRNNTDGDILIKEFVNEDGFLVAEIYGEEPTDKVVSMSSEKVEEDLGKGIKWATYKTETDENGEAVQDGLLYETTYSYNPPVPEEMKHETSEPRGSGWLDLSNTTNWNDKR